MIKHFFITTTIFIFCISCSETNIDPQAVQDNLTDIMRTVTFESDIMAINEKHCIACHRGNTPDGGLLLTNFQQVLNSYRNGTSITRIENGTMPPAQKPRLTPQEIQLVLKWQEDGFLETE